MMKNEGDAEKREIKEKKEGDYLETPEAKKDGRTVRITNEAYAKVYQESLRRGISVGEATSGIVIFGDAATKEDLVLKDLEKRIDTLERLRILKGQLEEAKKAKKAIKKCPDCEGDLIRRYFCENCDEFFEGEPEEGGDTVCPDCTGKMSEVYFCENCDEYMEESEEQDE